MSTEDRLESALRRILRPLARLAIARGVALPSFVRILKRILVQVAEEEFRVDDKPPTDSRIAVLTGVHRKDVRTLREEDDTTTGQPKMPIIATVLGRWLADPQFQTDEARPMALPRLHQADGPSFASLVETVASDVRPRTILDAMVTRGSVVTDEATDTVRLVGDGDIPFADDEDMLSFFAANLHDHAAAAVHNLQAPQGDDRFLERAVFYSGLTPTAINQIEEAVSAAARQALVDVNALARDRQQADSGDAEASRRFRFGVYFYSDDDGSGSSSDHEAGSD
ncbi:MAG: DUF6502 family protein [Pseudomonadota bacterium]